VDLSREEFRLGMRMLYAHGPLPGVPKGRAPRFILASADAAQMVKAEGYLQWCQRITGKRFDCWEDLNASGGLDDEGATYVALHLALGEALEDAASAVQSMTPTQVRAMLSVMFLGMIVELLSPEPVTKFLFVLTATNLIAYVGVDLFNSVVKGFTAMLEELRSTRDFDGVRAAGIHYGQRLGPTVARIVVMIATYGVAKFAGLFKGSALDLPGGSRAAALAEAQGLPVGGARSIALSADGSVVIELGTVTAMTAALSDGNESPPPTPTGRKGKPLRVPDGTNQPREIGGRPYSGHALDRMQEQGITPTTVEAAIRDGRAIPGKIAGTTAHYDPGNNMTVITNSASGKVITVDYGEIRQ
jgi:hypothetical protein